MRAPRSLIALAAAAAVLPLAGCGSSGDEGLLTAKQAHRLSAWLEASRRAADDGRCNVAREAAQNGADRASALSSNVDHALQRNLVQGFSHLVDTINSECGADEKATPTPTATETPTPTATATQTAAPTPTPTATETPSPTPTPTATATETATPDTGGASEPQRGIGDSTDGGG
jgi:hypothetical protein